MRRAIRKVTKQILMPLIIIMALLLCVQTTSIASDALEGSIYIHLKSLGENSKRAGVGFAIYQVGELEDGITPVFYDEYGIEEYPQTAEDVEETIAKLLGELVEETPVTVGKTDEDGGLGFVGVKEGVYLIVPEFKKEYGRVQPFIIHMPYFEEKEDGKLSTSYDVEVTPKAEVIPPDEVPEEEIPPIVTPPKEGAPSMNPIKTGDSYNLYIYIIIAAMSIFAILIILFKRRERRRSIEEQEGNTN
ncbi:MAG: hypothetical protein ACK5LL_13500 [Suipraeoptans sp.]